MRPWRTCAFARCGSHSRTPARWVRLEAERARPVYAARAEDTFDLDAAGRAAYLGAVLDLALDRGAGLVQMQAFVESYPNDTHVPDAWLWLGDAWAAACGGSW